jgi:hypothetical protein
MGDGAELIDEGDIDTDVWNNYLNVTMMAACRP